MTHSTGQPFSRFLLAALAFASPLLAQGDEGKLAPVIDLNPRHYEAGSGSLEEPKALVVAAEAAPLLSDTGPPAVSPTNPHRNFETEHNQSQPQPAVRYATPFDPTAETHPQQTTERVNARQDAATLAPVIRVYEPIRPAQPSRVINSRIAAKTVPQLSGFIQITDRNPVSGKSELEEPHRSAPRQIAAELPQTVAFPPRQALASNPGPVLKLVEERLPERLTPRETLSEALVPTATAPSVVQFADAEPLLAFLQPSPSASDLPAPMEEAPLSAEQAAEAAEIEAFELGVKPIHELSVQTRPDAGELPTNYASARFAREGKIAHRMGFSRSKTETLMMWEAPALCHRPLYFEDINLERHGYKVPLIQPALSAAHFFGRVPLLPYMMVSEGRLNCQYTLGHYRPGDYAPYSLYVPRLRLDASAAEAAVIAGVLFAFP